MRKTFYSIGLTVLTLAPTFAAAADDTTFAYSFQNKVQTISTQCKNTSSSGTKVSRNMSVACVTQNTSQNPRLLLSRSRTRTTPTRTTTPGNQSNSVRRVQTAERKSPRLVRAEALARIASSRKQ